MKIAWIGTGVMGYNMIQNLIKDGNDLIIYNRSRSKRLIELENEGVKIALSIAEAIEDVEVVCTMLGYPKDVEEVYCESGGIIDNASSGMIAIDFTTSSPQLAMKLYSQAKQSNIQVLDAPVSGGDTGAKNGTLSIMVGGDIDTYTSCQGLFASLGTAHYMGSAGFGQHTKACNQIAVAGAVAAMSEAMVYAKSVGLDQTDMLNAIRGGAAGSWQLNNTADRVLNNDFEPGFYIKHFIKDMNIAIDEMNDCGVTLEMLEQVCKMYQNLSDKGFDNCGTQALIKYYKD